MLQILSLSPKMEMLDTGMLLMCLCSRRSLIEVIDVQQNRSTMAALICKMLHNKLNAVSLLVSGMKVLAVFRHQ